MPSPASDVHQRPAGANVAVEPITWGPTISEFPMPRWLAAEGFTCLEVLLQWGGQRFSEFFFGRDEHEPVAMKANLLAVATKSSLKPGMATVAFPIDIRTPKELHQQPGGGLSEDLVGTASKLRLHGHGFAPDAEKNSENLCPRALFREIPSCSCIVAAVGSLSTRPPPPSLISCSCAIYLRLEIVGMNRSTMSCLPFIIMEAKSPAAEVGFQSHDTGCTSRNSENLCPLSLGNHRIRTNPRRRFVCPGLSLSNLQRPNSPERSLRGSGSPMAFQGGEIPRIFALSTAGEVPGKHSRNAIIPFL
jgi:hypothetical protein